MTDALHRTTSSAARFLVRETRDARYLDRALADECVFAAYAVAQLEPELFEDARFWVAEGTCWARAHPGWRCRRCWGVRERVRSRTAHSFQEICQRH